LIRPMEGSDRQLKPRISKDFHVHESHSSDARGATVEGYCRVAEERGIDEIGFATHLITAGPDMEHGISPDLIPEYFEEITEAQASTSVKLRVGLEVDYFPEEERRLARLLDDHPFDFILGSLHYVQGIDIGSRRGSAAFFTGRRIEEALNIYFDEWRRAVETGLFDVMAHPDYFRKYLRKNQNTHSSMVSWEEYGSVVYDAIDSLKSYSVGVEVNSSGYRHGIRDCYPVLDFMKIVQEAGVDAVTIGSDTHTIEGLGFRLEEAIKRLEAVGYSYVCIYERRKSKKISLSDVGF